MGILGSILMILGLLVGLADGFFIVTGGNAFGFSWIVSVALAKMIFISSLGLLGVGAVLQRLANREAMRSRLSEAERLRAGDRSASVASHLETSKGQLGSANAMPIDISDKNSDKRVSTERPRSNREDS
jgi:hypothetical protein